LRSCHQAVLRLHGPGRERLLSNPGAQPGARKNGESPSSLRTSIPKETGNRPSRSSVTPICGDAAAARAGAAAQEWKRTRSRGQSRSAGPRPGSCQREHRRKKGSEMSSGLTDERHEDRGPSASSIAVSRGGSRAVSGLTRIALGTRLGCRRGCSRRPATSAALVLRTGTRAHGATRRDLSTDSPTGCR